MTFFTSAPDPDQPAASRRWLPCRCSECDGGCDNLAPPDPPDSDECDECSMGIHRQDREGVE